MKRDWNWEREERVRVRKEKRGIVNGVRLNSKVKKSNKVGFYEDYKDKLQRLVSSKGQRGVKQRRQRLEGIG